MQAAKKYYLPIIILALSFSKKGQGQSLDYTLAADTIIQRPAFIVNDIIITGNRQTKSYIIERELPFKKGDSVYLPDLVAKFQRAKELLINTRLFNDAIVSLKSFHGYKVDIEIDVLERWYIFPIPYFKPVDRNLAVWGDKGYSLDRINYGMKFSHYNFTGRNDKLRLWLITGYTRQIQLSYDQPYADKTLRHGFNVGFFYSGLKEINAATINNKQFFLDSLSANGKYLNEQMNFTLGYSYRPAIKTRHSVRLSVNYLKVDSTVININPKYFNNGKRQVVFPELSYELDYQNVDYAPYALRGFMGNIALERKGINKDMNLTQLNARFTRGWSLGWKSYFGLQGYGILKLPLTQPFYNQQLLGYGDYYLRGLEKYVEDGVAAVLVRNTLRRELFNFNVPFMKGHSHDHIPFRIYAKTYTDFGYAYNKDFTGNSLVNKMLYTAGAGIDVVTFYDLVLRFEYSVNQLCEKGFFFHVRNDF